MRIIMKSLSFVLACMLAGMSEAQVAHWVIHPSYDEVRVAQGADDIFITDSAGVRTMWSYWGSPLVTTKGSFQPIAEDMVVITTRNNDKSIWGFSDKWGKTYQLANCQVTRDYPFFSDGYLLVKGPDSERFVSKKGKVSEGRFVNSYPFFNGFASCSSYENAVKQRGVYHFLIDNSLHVVTLKWDGKLVDWDDADFVSSVNENKKGIIVIKNKLFIFDGDEVSIKPLYGKMNDDNLKNQAKAIDNFDRGLKRLNDSTWVFYAKGAKEGNLTVYLDNMLRTRMIQWNNKDVMRFDPVVERKPEEVTHLRSTMGDKFWGLSWKGKEILPPQFDEEPVCFGINAFVNKSGKWGVLRTREDNQFKLSLNKGNDIAFRHQKFETLLRLDLPKEIPASKVNVEIDPATGCEIDKTSRFTKDTDYGNYVEYKCVLNIPEDLTDERYPIVYPTRILYDGLESPVIPFTVNGWHYKYFSVDVNDSETSVSQRVVTFTFDITAERLSGENVYPVDVVLKTDSLYWEKEKLSEMRYKCKVHGLKSGVNEIAVQILEEGCPPTSFPFEFTYSQPTSKVVVKKVKPAPPVKVSKPSEPSRPVIKNY